MSRASYYSQLKGPSGDHVGLAYPRISVQHLSLFRNDPAGEGSNHILLGVDRKLAMLLII